jgi:hypothetical protein
MRSAQANRSIHGRSSDSGLIGDNASYDGSRNEGRRREPPPIVLAIAATVLPISSVPIVVAPVATPFETPTLNAALLTRAVEAAALKSVPIIITTELHLLHADACNIRLQERKRSRVRSRYRRAKNTNAQTRRNNTRHYSLHHYLRRPMVNALPAWNFGRRQ